MNDIPLVCMRNFTPIRSLKQRTCHFNSRMCFGIVRHMKRVKWVVRWYGHTVHVRRNSHLMYNWRVSVKSNDTHRNTSMSLISSKYEEIWLDEISIKNLILKTESLQTLKRERNTYFELYTFLLPSSIFLTHKCCSQSKLPRTTTFYTGCKNYTFLYSTRLTHIWKITINEISFNADVTSRHSIVSPEGALSWAMNNTSVYDSWFYLECLIYFYVTQIDYQIIFNV